MLRTVRALVVASHAPPAVAVTTITGLLALDVGRGPAGIAWACAAMLAGQLSVGWNNDYLDADRDHAVGRPDKPLATGELEKPMVRRAAFIALGLAVVLSFGSGRRAAAAHLVALGAAWSYNRWLKHTPASVVPFAVAFGLLPAFVVLGLPGHPWPAWWLVTAGALLGSGAHFANVLPDLADDARTGVRGLPHRLGAAVSAIVAGGLLAAAAVVLALGPPGGPGALGIAGVVIGLGAAAAVVVLTVRGIAPRVPFALCMAVAALDVALLVLR